MDTRRLPIPLLISSGIALLPIAAKADLLFYEPFDYVPNSALAGLMPTLGAGGPWVDNSSGTGGNGSGQEMTVRANGTIGVGSGQTWPGIPSASTFVNSGGYLEGERRNDNSGHIPLSPEVTAKFTDGATIWLSFVSAATTVNGLPDNHHKPNVAIGQGELLDDRAQFAAGEAVGGGVAHNTSGGNPRARYWDDQNTGGVFEDFLGNALSRIRPQQLFITKIEFGAVTERITSAVFDLNSFGVMTEADFDSASDSSITTVNNLDNASFDTLSFHGSRSNYDEIRIGTTFDDVIGASQPPLPPQPGFQITQIVLDSQSGDLSLTWTSQPGESYGIYWSTDLQTYYPDVNQSIPAHATDDQTSLVAFANPLPESPWMFLRIGPPDIEPPTTRVVSGDSNEVTIAYSEPLLPGAATDPSSYFLSQDDGGAITVLSVRFGDTPDTVILTVGSPLQFGSGYTLGINGITDPAGLAIADDTEISFTPMNPGEGVIPLKISEFLASNGSGPLAGGTPLFDVDGDSSDWIEIHNPLASDVLMDGWYLTDDIENPTKWRFPAVTVDSGGYLVVFASGKDLNDPAGELHANFKLSAEGKYLALVMPDTTTVAFAYAPEFPEQVAGVSFGVADDTGDQRYFDVPTPGTANPPSGFISIVGDTQFDVDRGIYEDPFELIITSVTPGATIRYTLDMSEPTMSNGQTYVPGSPIAISSTTCLRARAYIDDWLPSNIDTQTYIFLDDIISQPTNPPGFPSSWRNATADYDFDPAVAVRYTEQQLKDALLSLPSLSLVTDMDNLFDNSTGIYDNPRNEGPAWERPVSAEWIDHTGGPEFQVNCGIRIQGNAARNVPKKPFRLLFKSVYGDSKLEFPMFGDAVDAAKSFDTIILRSNGQGINYGAKTQITDENGRRALLDMDTPQAHGTYVHLYVNGIYWGLYNPSERPQASFCENYIGGIKEEWDVNNGNTAIDGTYAPFDAMLVQVRGGPANDEAFQKIQGNNPDGTPNPAFPAYLDMPNYIDYMLCNFYLGTGDWAGNESQGTRNYYCGRWRNDDSSGYKWFMWDAERSLQNGIPTGARFGPAEPYDWLKSNSEFRLLFADHAQRHLSNDGALTPGVRLPRYTALADQVRAAMICEEARWDRTTVATFEGEVANRTNNWFSGRSSRVLAHLRSVDLYPSIDAPVFAQRGGSIPSGGSISFTATSGTIYYTVNGSDPRLLGGAINGNAETYSGSIPINTPMTVSARTYNSGSGEWSALNSAFFSIDSEPASSSNLVISEIHYHPAEPSAVEELAESTDRDDYEFVELFNVGAKAVDLTGVLFDDGISFVFPDNTLLASGARIVLVRDLDAFTARYGSLSPGVIAGQYTGRLSNDGERLALSKNGTGVLHEVTYNDQLPWPTDADGIGYPLFLVDPTSSPNHQLENSWSAHAVLGGTPGVAD